MLLRRTRAEGGGTSTTTKETITNKDGSTYTREVTSTTPKTTSQQKQCASAYENAKGACVDTLGLGNIGNSLGGALSQSSSPDPKAQCEAATKMAELSALLNGAKAAACETMIQICKSNCPAIPEGGAQIPPGAQESATKPPYSEETDTYNKMCGRFQANVLADAAQLAVGLASAIGAQKTCDSIAVAALVPPPLLGPPGFGGTLPAYVATDCSNPANANSAICLSCTADPTKPGCPGAVPDPRNAFNTNPGAGGPGYQSAINENPAIDANVKPVAGGGPKGNEIPDKPGGGPAGMGGNGSGARANADDGSRNPAGGGGGFNTGVLGGAGQPGGFGGFAAGGKNGSGEAGGARSWADKLKKFGLNGLVPDKNAYKAGANPQISGANGPSIWEKVSNQYVKDPYLAEH